MEKIWVRLPLDWIGRLSSGAIVLLSVLMNKENAAHQVVTKIADLANIMHCSVRQIERYLNELTANGLIVEREQQLYCSRITLAPDILPPKKRNAQTAQPGTRPGRRSPDDGCHPASFDLSDFEQLINRF